ncbi:MAG TPA: ROK family protein [Alphaproteobacteria bacterium]|nr:ROK family protein [Alphaproteobacteria bacterium]
MAGLRIGIDLGGSKIEGWALGAAPEPVARRRVAAPRGDYEATIRAIVDTVAALEADAGERGTVGIGIPGAISPATGLVKNANSSWLIGQPFDRDLATALGRPVRVANDANCLAVSEATDGAGAGARTVFGVILGTGVGGGLAIDGRPVLGANAIAGEWGHNPLPRPRDDERPGPQCYCGRQGCIETFLSGPGLARDFAAAGGGPLDAKAIAEHAAKGEAMAQAAVDRYAERLARALAGVINIVDPDVIVLGGGLSNIDGLCETVATLWGEHVFSDTVATRLTVAAHGDASGVRGAAWLWPEGEAP